MKSFNKKVLASAVMATMAGAAHAVYVDNNGLGQALIYPYYTVQGGHNTYVSVVNTTSSAKVVKVRFREGKNSREVLDFNLYLSPNDVWTGAVIPSTVTAGARLITADASCTNPRIPADGIDFRNYAYLLAADGSAAGTGLDRTREGYLEMIEMGTLSGTAAANATHGAVSGIPANCAALRGVTVNLGTIGAPTGGLMGTGTLINVTNGQDSGYSALALAAVYSASQYVDIGNDAPNLSGAEAQSLVVSGNRAHNAILNNGRDAVSSVITHSAVLNEYVLDTGTNSNTDWVLTFPTKQFYVGTASAARPFTAAFTSAGACEPISFTFYDREERSVTPSEVDFSPLPPGATGASVCWESTVVSIRNGVAHTTASGTASGVLGSVNTTAVSVTAGFQNGWAAMTFTGANAALGIGAASGTTTNLTSSNAVSTVAPTYVGLPVVGFMVRTFNNGTLGNFQANYGSAFEHKYRQTIFPIQ